MIVLRKALPELVHGKYELLDKNNAQVYAYTRTLNNKKVLVLLNFSATPASFRLPSAKGKAGEVLINNLRGVNMKINNTQTSFILQPYQSVLIRLK